MKESGPRLGGGAFPAQGAQLLAEKDGYAVWQFQNESGEGTMTVYDVFPGVMLSFNDFHMARYESAYVARRPLFAIDHCREGRMEYAAGENAVAYTGAGDMKLDLRRQHTGVFRFPSSHYHGLTVAFDLETASSSLSQQGQDFPVTPEQIITRWQLGDYPKVVHGADVMEHIFGEMYRVPEKVRIPYFRVKILEMLLYLDTISIPDETEEQPYFYRTQVEKVQAIRDFLAEHLSETTRRRSCPGGSPAADGHEGLLPLCLRRFHRRMADGLPDEPRCGASAAGPAHKRRRNRRHGGPR